MSGLILLFLIFLIGGLGTIGFVEDGGVMAMASAIASAPSWWLQQRREGGEESIRYGHLIPLLLQVVMGLWGYRFYA